MGSALPPVMTRAAIIAIAIALSAQIGVASPRIAIIEEHIHPMVSRPELFVGIESATAARHAHAELVRTTLLAGLASTPRLTTVASEARRFHLDGRRLDIAVVRLDDADGTITAELRAMISDDTGKMLAVVSSCARIDIPRRLRTSHDALRAQALRDAAEDLSGRLQHRLLGR